MKFSVVLRPAWLANAPAVGSAIARMTPEIHCMVQSSGQLESREARLIAEPSAAAFSEESKKTGSRWLGADLRDRLRKGTSFLVVLTMLLLTVVFVMARTGMNDPDIWWHLRNAEYLLQHHQLPAQDLYSFTVAGQAWINHEWLAEIPYYLAWRAFGLAGLKTVSIVMLQLIFLGLLYLCYQESRNFKASIAACSLSVFLATVSFGPRTILFGYAYVVILLIILQRFRNRASAPLWLIPPLFCLWINTHGSWSLGLILFAIIVAAGLANGTWGKVQAQAWTSSQRRKLIVTGLASVAALFVNPVGPRLVLYPLDLAFRQKLNVAHVAEWVSVDFHNTRGKLVLALIVLLLLGALLRSYRWTLAELGLLLFALYSGLTYMRFLFLLGIVVAPLVAKLLDFLPPYRREADTPLINTCVILLMIGSMIHYWPTSAELQRSVDMEYPTHVLPFLKAHPPNGPMLNFYLWGGYLEWYEPNVKVFIDSRVDIFEYAGVLKDYLDLLGIREAKPVLDKYNIRYVLFPSSEVLTYELEHDPQWKVLYSDKLSVLLERVNETSGKAAAANP
jgi:hypothetical protein